MEKQKLPNEKAVMILGLTSFVGCCCTSGILGVILSGIGLYLAKKSEATYNENPEIYDLGSLNTWKIVNIVSLILSVLVLGYWIYMKASGQDIEQQRQFMEMLEQYRK
jgi:hypothetical protein